LRYRAERQCLGFDHATVGRALLKAWKLPEAQQEAVGLHHEPTQAVRFPIETATVHVSDIIANALQVGSSGERLVPPLVPEAWAALRLPDGIVPELIDEVERQLPVAISQFVRNSES
jgi:hypothetical protein